MRLMQRQQRNSLCQRLPAINRLPNPVALLVAQRRRSHTRNGGRNDSRTVAEYLGSRRLSLVKLDMEVVS